MINVRDITVELLDRLFSELSDGVCISDVDGAILYANPAAKTMMALKEGGADGKNICEQLCGHLMDPHSKDRAGHCLLRMRDGDEKAVTARGRHGPMSIYEWQGASVRRCDRWRDLRVRCTRLRTDLGDGKEGEKHFTFIEDASAEMDLERHREDWRNMVAHDLRNPLTNVAGALMVLEEIPAGRVLTGKEAGLVAVALKACRRITELLDLYVEVAQIDAGAMPVFPRRTELTALLAEAAEEQAAAARAKNIEVRAAANPGLAAFADSKLIFRILQNLLNNAIKFTPDGGRIELEASGSGESVEILVRDSGPGISALDSPFIFDRFYQARARREGRLQGNGLGLTFCREALAVMGGEIELRSRPGAGAEFAVRLPRAGGAES